MWFNKLSVSRVLSGMILLMAMSGCSAFLPYESDFACKNTDFGKCIHPEDAYKEALGDTRNDAVSNERAARQKNGAGHRHTNEETATTAASGYDGYQEAVYTQLATIVEAPVTPMVAPAKTVRTLILPYADARNANRLYMPRFVYSVLEQPKFVLGDYLLDQNYDYAGVISQGLLQGPPAREGEPDHGATPEALALTPASNVGGSE